MIKAQPRRRPWELTAFGRLIKEHLHVRGLTQGELAEAAGVSQETISRAMHGKQKPGTEVVSKISAALALSPEEKLQLVEAVEHDYATAVDASSRESELLLRPPGDGGKETHRRRSALGIPPLELLSQEPGPRPEKQERAHQARLQPTTLGEEIDALFAAEDPSGKLQESLGPILVTLAGQLLQVVKREREAGDEKGSYRLPK